MQTIIETKGNYNFPVSLEKVYTAGGVEAPRVRAVVRGDTKTPISVVSDQYKLITHHEALSVTKGFMQRFGDVEPNYHVEKDGARMLATYTFKNHTIKVPKVDDVVALRITVINSYDRATSLNYKIGAMVLRCLNGMTVPKGFYELRFRHTTGLEDITLPEPDLVFDGFRNAGKEWNALAEQDISSEKRDFIIDQALAMQIVSKQAFDQNKHEYRAATTMWALYNAFTYSITHQFRGQESGRLSRLDRLNTVFMHTQ